MLANLEMCTGCSACVSICPQNCINLEENKEGFDYPKVNRQLCIDCRLCEKTCPVGKEVLSTFDTKSVAVQNKNEEIRSKSSAGGFVGAIAEYVFSNKGVLYGAGFTKENHVKHMRVTSIEECFEKKIFSSKYVSSELGGIFNEIKNDLNKNLYVCFVGLPCQVAGLICFLGKKYSNLLTIDLTCYGVPSRKLYRMFLDYLEKRYKSKIRDVKFRDKIFGYSAPTMSVEFENGRVCSQNSAVKTYLRTFFANISIRKSCSVCFFKGVDRLSDFTIGDCKNIKSFVSEFDDDKGTTVLYVHSQKGEEIISNLENCRINIIPLDKVIDSCGKKMVQRVVLNEKREDFFSDIDDIPYEVLIDKYCPANFEERVANIVKGLLRATGLNNTSILRRLKRR